MLRFVPRFAVLSVHDKPSAYNSYRGCPMDSTGILSLKILLLSCCFCHSAYAAFPFSELQYVIIDEYNTLASESIS